MEGIGRDSIHPLALGRRRSRELGDGCEDALPDCTAVYITSLEQLIGAASRYAMALYQNIGGTQDIEIIYHPRDGAVVP